ncbi:C-Jun-amino-terminal kinase-interacting protein 3-like isoform X6 [Ostrea edulis]|uniref:C-Jun-amino-terminal kinase-interacting protein 3-like isoform X6 n=1 Tax=Ostrea edulis TaxID=37623 RepID=UPI0024AFC289|nr:C-Jun-amino-terminal kinase-interacting protein 3-like isoform X6 [Ostrea edulis]
MKMAAITETVYGTSEEGHVMSEKVSSLATNIYKEFERMIKKYDEDVVKELMPLIVGLLEGLDQSLSDKQEADVELELLRDDNEQLLTQYEREKQLRKGAEQKYLEMEDAVEGEKKSMQDKVESLESVVRMLELKVKNSSDHVSRMEEKETDLKKEYTKLHERYTELFRTHMDYMERAKIVMGTDRMEVSNSPRSNLRTVGVQTRILLPRTDSEKSDLDGVTYRQTEPVLGGGFQLPSLRPVSIAYGQNVTARSGSTPPSFSSFDDMMSPRSVADSNVSLQSELGELESPQSAKGKQKETKTCDQGQVTDSINVREFATATKPPNNTEENNDTTHPKDSEEVRVEKGNQGDIKQNTQVSDIESKNTVSTEDSPCDSAASQNSQSDTQSTDRTEKQLENESGHVSVDNSDAKVNIQTVDSSPEVRQPTSEFKTSTPQTDDSTSRERYDSRLSIEEEEAEFEEDKIMDFSRSMYISGLDHTLAKIIATTPELQEIEESMSSVKSNRSRGPKRNNDSIFDELQSQDNELIGDVDFGITGREVNPGDYASSVSDNFFGMGKELENLILENTELLETKNALNIVKDDLIAKVDELSGEVEILKEEINNLQTVKTKLNTRIKDLEDELKKTKEELEKKNTSAKEGVEEDDVPMAQRKRFTRVEMARVLMERNQYKERLMELQEAVRWTEMIRASREHPDAANSPQKQKKGSIWNFFGNLFSSSSPNKPNKKPSNVPMATIKYNAPTTQVQPMGDPNRRSREMYKLGDKAKAYDFLQDDLNRISSSNVQKLLEDLQEKKQQYDSYIHVEATDAGASKIESLLEDPVVTAQPKMSEKAKKERDKERQEQYKQVRAHVKKDDGRLQAYGWSLPAKFQPSVRDTPTKREVPVPVPVYCRPILEKETGVKIWCAAGVNLTGGRTRDGGSVVGASVFYSSLPESESESRKEVKDEVDRLNQELKDHEKGLKDADKEQLSSLVWICHSSGSSTHVSVIDANSPGDILETFKVSSSPILCLASVAGALESDYPVDEEILKAESYPQYKPPPPSSDNSQVENSGIGGITFVQCATGNNSQPSSPQVSPVGSYKSKEVTPEHKSNLSAVAQALTTNEEKVDTEVEHKDKFDTESIMSERSYEVHFGNDDVQPSVFKARGSPANSGTNTPVSRSSLASLDRHRHSELIRDGLSPMSVDSDVQFEETEKMSSVLPTIWLGSQTGSLYVHSSVAQWRRCLYSVKLRDSILNIVHVKGRVLVALADGTISIFHRDTDGLWDLQNYHLLDLGKPHHSIRCMTVIANKHVWCGYRNKIHVIEPKSMTIEKTFDAHPRKESQVRQLSWVGDGVWVSIRLDSTLRLYHAYTHQHLQDVDIEPYVSKMLGTGKLGFSFVRITAMLISCNRLWIGTGNGVIISVPLSESNKQTVSSGPSGGRPGGIVRVYSDTETDSVTPGTFIPYCSMAQAQLSFHGHRDAVKFFVSVPGSPRKGLSAATDHEEPSDNKSRHEAIPIEVSNAKLVLSGGEGYVDFRIGDGDDDNPEEEEKKLSLSKGDKSHLIVWEVNHSK